ncbi:glycine cleavage system aminomethyltransferase GcvT [Phosphitispora fastidiosa]|uniref:glycine cleavage system aminomethyltransferase GcvT n=1 Tax=Phosphitispora fastidiosa TaxID=2837202 RepID=UPI001E421DF3|nr:aminomethyltransferase [Phosphitispora fastidiosa]
MTNIKRTPLYETHVNAGAKIVEFGGWEMPIQYTGIIEEHNKCRTAAGIFDVSHMGEIDVQGPDALKFVNNLVTNDVAKMALKQCLYSPMCYENGGVVDDLLVYKMADDHYYIVVNAANTDKDYDWFLKNVKGMNVKVENISSQVVQIALQGPKAESILQKISDCDLSGIKYYWFDYGKVDGIDSIISRTGYTGEDGFEIYTKPEFGPKIWDKIMETGKDAGVAPIGLGARDTLRLEARLPLYGHEMSDSISPLEAGLGIFVKLNKEAFNGKDALAKQKEAGLKRKLVGFEMVARGIPRNEYTVSKGGQEIGWVTSGSFAPSLNKNIGMALVKAEYAVIDSELEVNIRNKGVKAKIVPTPFYKRR